MPISEFHIKILMLEWMIDEEYLSGNKFTKIILTKYDKINFQNFLAPDMMLKIQIAGGDVHYS